MELFACAYPDHEHLTYFLSVFAMAAMDPLLALRIALSPDSSSPPVLTTSAAVPLDASNTTTDLTIATHLAVTGPQPQTFSLDAPTRFVSAAAGGHPVDLRSIYFAWLKKDVAIPEYIADAQQVNEALASKVAAGQNPARVINLVFVERLDLITWLEGASDESEYIRPLEGDAAAEAAAASASAAATSATGAGVGEVAKSAAVSGQVGSIQQVGGRPVKVIDPKLQAVYDGERKMGDRNSVLRGIKPTVCLKGEKEKTPCS